MSTKAVYSITDRMCSLMEDVSKNAIRYETPSKEHSPVGL